MTSQTSSLTREQWKSFLNNYWDKKGTIIKFSQKNPILTSEEAFEIVVQASEEYKNKGAFADFKMFINARQLVQEVKQHLPVKEDINFENFIKRLDNMTDKAEFQMYINKIERFSIPLHRRVKKFVKGFIEEMGLPSGPIETELFLGRYIKTPGGIHRAECTNFHFAIQGDKVFFVWPDDVTEKYDIPIKQTVTGDEEYLDSADFDWMKEHRTKLTAQPGEAIYCPSRWWHVGNSPEFCVCLNVSVYKHGLARDIIDERLQELYQPIKKSIYTQKKNNFEGSVVDYTKSILDAFKSANINQSIETSLLKYKTNYGISVTPPICADNLNILESNIFCLIPESGFDFKKLDNEKIIYSANGFANNISYASASIQILNIIKSQARNFSYKDIIHQLENHGVSVDKSVKITLSKILEDLYKFNALECVSEEITDIAM
jgi:ribosomal protein L16 Arg81 hydroxylase